MIDNNYYSTYFNNLYSLIYLYSNNFRLFLYCIKTVVYVDLFCYNGVIFSNSEQEDDFVISFFFWPSSFSTVPQCNKMMDADKNPVKIIQKFDFCISKLCACDIKLKHSNKQKQS